MSRKQQNYFSIVVGLLGLFIAIGVKTFLHPCVHADGSEAMCADAGQLIFYLGIALALLASGLTWTKGVLRVVCAAGLLILSVLLILAPGTLAPVCGMAEMTCRLVTQPAARVTGIVAAILSLVVGIGALRNR